MRGQAGIIVCSVITGIVLGAWFSAPLICR